MKPAKYAQTHEFVAWSPPEHVRKQNPFHRNPRRHSSLRPPLPTHAGCGAWRPPAPPEPARRAASAEAAQSRDGRGAGPRGPCLRCACEQRGARGRARRGARQGHAVARTGGKTGLQIRPRNGIDAARRRRGVTPPGNEGPRGQDGGAKGLPALAGGDGLSASQQQRRGESGTSGTAGRARGASAMVTASAVRPGAPRGVRELGPGSSGAGPRPAAPGVLPRAANEGPRRGGRGWVCSPGG